MSPRPRKASDQEILVAAGHVLARPGPGDVTLAEIAAECGVTAGAIVQRFGSKRDLLLALMRHATAGTAGHIRSLRSASPSAVEALRAYARGVAAMGDSPAGLAHHLGFLQLDLTDPDFRRLARAHARATRAALAGLVREAVAAGELRSETDVDGLARAVETTVSGSLITWIFHQTRPVRDWVLEDLDALLTSHLARREGGGTRSGRRRPRGGPAAVGEEPLAGVVPRS